MAFKGDDDDDVETLGPYRMLYLQVLSKRRMQGKRLTSLVEAGNGRKAASSANGVEQRSM